MQTSKAKRFEKIGFLGEGQVWVLFYFFSNFHLFFLMAFRYKFATVYKARDKETGLIVAVKKVLCFIILMN